MDEKILKQIYESVKNGQRVAMVTVTEAFGSAPRKSGSMMAVWQDGRILGSVGGGKVEYEVINEAKECIKRGKDSQFEHVLNEKGELGMQCGGSVKGFIKIFSAKPKLLIVGGGHIGENLYKLGKILGFNTVVIDDREEFANEIKFKEADEVLQGNIGEILLNYEIDNNTYIVIVTKGHKQDKNALKAVVSRRAAYIGMIGSRNKNTHVMNKLLEEGVSKDDLKKVYAPIGLNITSGTPEEIAFGILSEILLIKNNGSLNHMREIKKVEF
ncbi:XdhC/CoxI family protein [Clostridium sediminicola]|uniref:XdhC family protein n=1 Tax=Clostridium sediminicola TaxID=3114879 RepID=UPI0031F1DB8A